MDGCVCACLPRVLHLGEVEEGAEAGALAGAEGGVAVEEVEAEVDEAADGRLAVDEDVRLGEVPAARPHEERRGAVAEPVLPPSRRVAVGDRAGNRVAQVHLPAHQVLPRRRQRVLEVSLAPTITTTSRSRHVKILTDGAPELCAAYHEDLGAGVEGVDDHLARLGGPVISTVRSAMAGGTGRTPSRLPADGPRGRVEPGSSPASYRRCASRLRSMAYRTAPRNSRCRPATKASESRVRMAANSGSYRPRMSTPSGVS